jgi:predicted Zn finger-like uncharacterized protein
MRIQCPDCDALFEVPEAKLRPGRPVRCARCHATWIPVPSYSEPEQRYERPRARVEMEPEPPAMESWPAYEPLVKPMPERHEAEGSRLTVALAWLLSLAVLGAAVGAAYIERTEVMRLWPPSQRVYELVGLRG